MLLGEIEINIFEFASYQKQNLVTSVRKLLKIYRKPLFCVIYSLQISQSFNLLLSMQVTFRLLFFDIFLLKRKPVLYWQYKVKRLANCYGETITFFLILKMYFKSLMTFYL